jgi:hypothetical protein
MQILLDEKLRVIKSFIKESNIQIILDLINTSKIKKIDMSYLKTHSEEYDPFLV